MKWRTASVSLVTVVAVVAYFVGFFVGTAGRTNLEEEAVRHGYAKFLYLLDGGMTFVWALKTDDGRIDWENTLKAHPEAREEAP